MSEDRDAWDRVIENLTNEHQNPQRVEDMCNEVRGILTSDETIRCVAVQKKPIVNLAPDSAVLTNRRFILYRRRLLGRVSFEDYLWRDLSDVQLREEILGATLSMKTVHGRRLMISYLPKSEARRLYTLAQEMEEKVREERRRRELEDKRAAAGGVVVGAGTDAMSGFQKGNETDPAQRLKALKEMLDAGLITQSEFDGKRAEIISEI